MDKTINNTETFFVDQDQLELFPLLKEVKLYGVKKLLTREEMLRNLNSLRRIYQAKKRLREILEERKKRELITYQIPEPKPNILKPDAVEYAGKVIDENPLIVDEVS